tara:strand:- start:92869 stop:93000 length:132 start_codon:yes stop_codon:yes gene_type:complete
MAFSVFLIVEKMNKIVSKNGFYLMSVQSSNVYLKTQERSSGIS